MGGVLAREELGLNPDDLGSPSGAALSSFISFALGAAVPLIPFVTTRGTGVGTLVTTAAVHLYRAILHWNGLESVHGA